MRGLVKEMKGDLLTVRIVRREACGECRACLSGMMENDMDIEAKNLCDAEVGDWVELELQENAFMNAVLILYGIPLIGFFAGILLGYFVVGPVLHLPESLAAVAFGLLGIFLCYLWIRSQNPRWESGKYRPLAVSLAEEAEEGCGTE